MDRKDKIHKLSDETVNEILAFIKEFESNYNNRWMSAADIKNRLGLMLPAVPQSNVYGTFFPLFKS